MTWPRRAALTLPTSDTRAARGRTAVRHVGDVPSGHDFQPAQPERFDALKRAHRRTWPAQLPHDRHCAHRNDRIDCRLLRVHRAAESPTCSSAKRCRASSCRSTTTWSLTCKRRGLWDRADDQSRSSSQKARSKASTASPRTAQSCIARLGRCRSAADRYGCRTWRLHRSEPITQPVHGDADHRQALLDVPARVEVGSEDHLLPAQSCSDEIRKSTSAQRPQPQSGPSGDEPEDAEEEVACALRTLNPARPATDGTYRPDRSPTRCAPRPVGRGAGPTTANERATHILDPGFDLTLRPMRYPVFFDMYKDAIKNTWTVDEIDFSRRPDRP